MPSKKILSGLFSSPAVSTQGFHLDFKLPGMCIVRRWKTEQPRESFLILLLFPMKIAGVIFIVVARENPGPLFLSVSPDYMYFKLLLIYGSERIIGNMALHNKFKNLPIRLEIGGGWGGTLGISRWGCAAGTLEPLTFTRASSSEFCYPMLE